LHITKLTDYSLLLLCEMKVGEIVSSKVLSEKTKVPFATVNKLLRLLTQGGFCSSKGGKTGGFILTKPHSEVSLLDVISCIEGVEAHLTTCAGSKDTHCQLNKHCRISQKMKAIDGEIYAILGNRFLSDLF
jgi:Rrf2 family protein